MENEKNKIPKNFNRIVGEFKKLTNITAPGDILHIFKNCYGYLVLNTNTQEYCYISLSVLRAAKMLKIIDIV